MSGNDLSHALALPRHERRKVTAKRVSGRLVLREAPVVREAYCGRDARDPRLGYSIAKDRAVLC